MSLRNEIKRYEEQEKLINKISIIENCSYEEARKIWCTTGYHDMMEKYINKEIKEKKKRKTTKKSKVKSEKVKVGDITLQVINLSDLIK